MVRISTRDTAEHWRQCAQEARANAAQQTDPEMKRSLLEIAVLYEQLAVIAEKGASFKTG
jgi:hypothetical protein